MPDFRDELTKLLNKHGKDSWAGVSDYILAEYVDNCLKNLTNSVISINNTVNGASTTHTMLDEV